MVAVIYVDGLIHSGRNEANPFLGVTAGSKTIGRTLEEAARDPMVKAVVLRVDSPGGSALASEIIWKATQEVTSRKPLVVSMGNVAGSGGYYVSCGAPTIFADPTTLTGSIGVVGGKVVLRGLWDKLGISTYAVTRGKHAAMYSSEQPFSDSERAKAIALMEHVYKQFKDRVVTGRGERLKGEIDSLAGGRVYTGRQALAIGLVDRIGGLHDAIRHAAGEARIGEYEVEVLPRPKNIFEQLMESMSGEHDEDRLMAGPTRELLQGASMLGAVASLRLLDPQAAESLVNSVARLMLFRNERVLAVTPADVNIR
jgi:protease-4